MNNKRKLFMYIIKLAVISMWAGILFVYVGIKRESAAVLAASIAVMLASLSVIITFAVLVKRMTKDEQSKWQSYMQLEENKNVDFQEQLETVRSNFANDTASGKNRIPKLNAYGIKPFYDYSVMQKGKIYYGCLVQANNALFEKPLSLNAVLPAVFIYSDDEYYEQHPEELYPIAMTLFADKDNSILKNETSYFSNVKVPSETIVGGSVYMTVVMVYRENLPFGRLLNWNIVPLIAAPNESTSVFIVDSKYWTNDLIYKYTRDDLEKAPEPFSKE